MSSLQIPDQDITMPGPSRGQQHRPVSVAVQPTPTAISPPPTSSRRQRASHTVVSNQPSASHSRQHGGEESSRIPGSPAVLDVYNHPAAVAYLAAHPRRTIPKFGPYLLLHTLGEGEFGKVKLGLHSMWGEEVAVKLIRRGNVDSTVRMGKVEREIEVLRTLKHPNIVRLYDVIETDKYIGIILEYASGGELFDHILAHRYLKEAYASKLFYQLISGVWYIHQKKIVHRDLKLENLLLDRHRNVIITDFGFANRFEHRSDDLMQTSCGSPCYAAPELVISEGLYVGSAVDIWSCGVILYAMLAGYLPFDDDPANPDGDNINLLYKYIVNTPLSFPDYISDNAKDLLSMMLVPDPARRASLGAVMRHPWLAAFCPTPEQEESWRANEPAPIPRAFGRTVADLEREAMEQHQQKRLAYQRQMKAAAASQQTPQSAAPSSGRRADHAHHSYQPESQPRERKHRPEYLYETSVDQSPTSATSPSLPTPPTSAPVVSGGASGSRKGFVPSPMSLPMDEDDPFTVPSGPQTAGAVQPSSSGPPHRERRPSVDESGRRQGRQDKQAQGPTSAHPSATPDSAARSPKKSAAASTDFRHTIQVEYDAPRRGSGRRSEDREARRSEDKAAKEREARQQEKDRREREKEKPRERSASPPRRDTALPASPLGMPLVSVPASAPAVPQKDRERTPTKTSPRPPHAIKSVPTPAVPMDVDQALSMDPEDTVTGTGLIVHVDGASPPGTPIKFASENSRRETQARAEAATKAQAGPTPSKISEKSDPLTAEEAKKEERKETSSQGSRGHLRGLSAVGLGKIFGSGSTSPVTNGRVPSEGGSDSASATGKSGLDSRRPSTMQLPSDAESAASGAGLLSPSGKEKDSGKESKKGSRRNTLTVMVEPLRSIRNRGNKQRGATTPHTPAPDSAAVESAREKDIQAQQEAERIEKETAQELAPAPPGPPRAMQASTNKAKKVMDWFRTRSKGRESIGLGHTVPVDDGAVNGEKAVEKDRSGTPTQDTYDKAARINPISTADSVLSPPVVVTTPTSANSPLTGSLRTPSSKHALSPPGHSQRSASSTGATSPSLPSAFPKWLRPSLTTTPSKAPTTPKTPNDVIRIHHGPVDTTTVTTMAPPDAMRQVRAVLEALGVEVQVESEYKYRCVRPKKRKGVMGGDSQTTSPDLKALSMQGSAAMNGVDKRGLPVPAASPGGFSGGGMLRGLLMRRQSSQVSTTVSQANTSFDDEAVSPIVGEPSSIVQALTSTIYGDSTQDAGDEVRFSVELTRLDRLFDTYSLDIRRLKGNLRSYKFVYDTVRERADLTR
ncbi:hypothetical protein HGRIS_007027 [Hohenbuehelia grisea]|uniref:non-specific serine/threonine protein kinase n=1 Tax=Hohenbuehelia grisea TaxID=104357 RepID=A0ABR3JBE2_9AGAR